jgi:transmembrane sensor
MKSENEHIELLISKKLSGHATGEEAAELEYLTSLDPEIRKLYETSQRAWMNAHYPFTPAAIKADREKIKEKIIQKLSIPAKRSVYSRVLYRAAAGLAVPLLIAGGWYWGSHSSSSSEQTMSAITAPQGQIAECVLADGTHVWLNSASTIRYDPALTGKKRVVHLDGEAYFKVAKMPDRPFIVNTAEMQVKVLGTSFNVRAYSEEDQTLAILEEGSIELQFEHSKGISPVKLTPGECASFQKSEEKLLVENTETYLHTAWRDGKYIFKDADLKTIIRQLEKLYDIHIHLNNNSLNNSRFRGIFEYKKQNVFDALETIERITSLKYRMEGRDIWLE